MSLDSHSIVKQYLLGSLSPEEKSRFEEKYFADDELFEELEIVEDDLVDSYIRGELSDSDRELFENSVTTSTRLMRRVEFAQVLAKSTANQVEAPTETLLLESQDAIKSNATRSSWLTFPFITRLNPGFAFATIILLIAGGVVFIAWIRSREESKRLALQTAELQQQTQALSEEINKQRSELTAQLDAERAQNDRLLRELEAAQKQSTGSGSENTAFAFFLSPGTLRDPRSGNRKAVPLSATQLRITLSLPSDEHPSYGVTVKNVAEESVWSNQKLSARAGVSGRVIDLRIRRSQLKDGSYFIDVYGVSSSGQTERVAKYSFQIVTRSN